MSVQKLSFIVITAVSFCFAATHYHEIDALKGHSIKGYSVYHEINEAKGLIVIFDGFANAKVTYEQAADFMFGWTKIPEIGYQNGLVTIAIPYDQNLFMTGDLYESFRICVNDAIRRYHVDRRKYVVGGFSSGGTMAVSFAEYVVRDKLDSLLPKAVFAVDPVLDLYELYQSLQREIERGCKVSSVGVSEAKAVTQLLDSTLGKPDESLAGYVRNSPFFMKDSAGGNARYLRTVPVRFYHELDPMWSMRERNRSILDENGVYGCMMIHHLYMAGNKEAEVILTQNRGSRPDGSRHPHSWNIADEKQWITWAEEKLNR